MLHNHIETAIHDVQALIAMTAEDTKDIREANHQAIFSRVKPKEELVSSFDAKMNTVKNLIQEIAQTNPQADIKELLSEDDILLFDKLNNLIIQLKQENLHFAKLSIAVGEFYKSLLGNLIPSETTYQGKRTSSDVQFITVDA